jgi:hypothetical protein
MDLVIRLAHELGVALELSYDAVELRELWGDALDGLRETRQLILNNDLPVPEVIDNVIKASEANLHSAPQ